MSTTLKTLHDRLLEGKPEAAEHVASECPWCIADAKEIASSNLDGGTVADAKTYTQEEHDALLAQVEDLKTKVAELSKVTEESELDAKITAAKAELEAQVADLQTKLDTATLEASAAKEERDAIVSWLDNEKTAAAEAALLAERKETRLAQVKEAASFPAEYLESNADRFAAMSDDDFEKALEDWKVIAPKKGSTKETIPAVTAMTASNNNDSDKSVLTEVMNLRFQGVDVRTVR